MSKEKKKEKNQSIVSREILKRPAGKENFEPEKERKAIMFPAPERNVLQMQQKF